MKTKLRQPNSVGVIDSDYRGEVAMMFDNIASEGEENYVSLITGIDGKSELDDTGSIYDEGTYLVRKGDRVCQGVIQKLPDISLVQVDVLSETDRGSGGFGSTGVNKND